MPYEPVRFWNPQDPITQDQLHKISRNQDFINQVKGEGRLRNLTANGNPRKSPQPPFKAEDLAIYSVRVPVTAKLANLNPAKNRVTIVHDYPSNAKGDFFKQTNLPVVNVSITQSNKKRLGLMIRNITTTGVKIQVLSYGTVFTPGEDSFTLNIVVTGVKGDMWE